MEKNEYIQSVWQILFLFNHAQQCLKINEIVYVLSFVSLKS